jgi:tetratricopeptide (TPR) repeat protein
MAALSLVEIEDTKKTNKEKEKDLRAYLPVMASSVVAFGITNFFGFSVIPVYYAMTLLSAVPLAELAEPKDKHPLPLAAYGYTVSIIVVAVYFLPLRLFLADYYYTLGKSNNSIADLRKAVALRPAEDLFHSALAEAYATHANDADAKELALREAAFTAKHNPYHLNYFKSRVKVYLAFAASDPTYYTQAASELARARQLAPTDPKLAYNLGLVYSRLGDIEKAETQINQAIELKKDYADAYYALTLLYEQTKQTDKIPQLLTTAQSNLATYSALLKEKIDKYTPAVTR